MRSFLHGLISTGAFVVVVSGIVAQHGVDGLFVSNHGGRAENSMRATITALPDVLAGTRGKIPVICDGGFRRGTDIYKALANGATGVGIGRPQVWGLAAFGQDGVERVLDLTGRHHGQHAQSEVADRFHLGVGHIARPLDLGEDTGLLPATAVHDRITGVGEHPGQVARNPTPGHVGERVDRHLAGQLQHGRGIDDAGSEELVGERVVGAGPGRTVEVAARTVEECVRLSREDMTIRTALLESRHLWGDDALAAELRHRFFVDVVKGTAAEFVAAKLAERDAPAK